ncbi:bifunctional riboflavin kinase/FAD synthetase [Sandaracinobacter neustonicus]|uniref:Riboflavin biosynthesis protein n=1 Tax=Sandaracinobacter neustonicus TaxID=1715348 RepID=A0A501XKC9_9SPHN|nr:bifunctional riboflavin kinase/FAD synthetase [Sandaracinobacter neustonicus]TPE61121.1 bifunctional riboflavin kinase/FAD synthetase [Sandaracinobacter neustonicus]
MKRLMGSEAVPASLKGGALALGNFDGVHAGHQAVIGAAVAQAHAAGRPALVATFDPHPSRHFRPDTPPFALTSLEQKLRLFEALGVDGAIVIPFDAALASLSAEAFASRWLAAHLGVSHVVTGEDFSFGKGRSGNPQVLAELGRGLGFTAQALKPVSSDGETVSSTRIREALAIADLAEARRLLTRPFAIAGEVVHGDKRGRLIGSPTANVDMRDYVRPLYGVYAVRVRLPDGSEHKGVANLGIRPMFDPPKEQLETWIFDWSGDLYGQTIEVQLIERLRPEMKFDGLDELIAQIQRDADAARAVLA